MGKRSLRVVKWLGKTPAEGVCTFCSRDFKVPLTALNRVSDAQEALHMLFNQHRCRRLDSSQNALRVVRESTEGKEDAPPLPEPINLTTEATPIHEQNWTEWLKRLFTGKD